MSGALGRAACAVAALGLLAAAGGLARAEAAEATFEEANRAYEAGRFAEAAETYRSLLRYDLEDPRLEYNLGNAEFRLGNLGQAILHYERARRLDPTDPAIRANLEFARSLGFDRVEPTAVPGPLRWIRALEDRVGPDRQAWLLLALVWVAAALAAWWLARPGRFPALGGWIIGALVVLAATVGVSWYVTWQRLEGTELAVVLADAAEVLAGPAENNAALTVVHEGLTLEVRGTRPEWVQVSLPNGLNGWIPRRAVGLV